MTPGHEQHARLIASCEETLGELYRECAEKAPNFDVDEECFQESLKKSIQKFVLDPSADTASNEDVESFLRSVKVDDLFMALACSNGIQAVSG